MPKLIAAKNINYGRLVNCNVRLDEKVIAIVGPNEAGKTTFLSSLLFANNHNEISEKRIPRLNNNNVEARVTLIFLLTDEDKAFLKDHFSLDTTPSKIEITKYGNGKTDYIFDEEPIRNATLYKYTKNAIEKADLTDETKMQFRHLFEAVENNERVNPSDYQSAIDEFSACNKIKEIDNLNSVIQSLDKNLNNKVATSISTMLPKFIFFQDRDRNLLGEYAITEIADENIPSALNNLLMLAGTSYRTLLLQIQKGEEHIDTLLEKCNTILNERFTKVWTQSSISPRLKYSNGRLSLQFRSAEGEITRFDARSTGLRSFVALLAFLYANQASDHSILLIDEAESHLHIDAQVSLIDTFVEQTLVDKIIYTTHSPACLPPDFGNAIKAVIPDTENDYRSTITANLMELNQFGVFPITYAMGATASVMAALKAALVVEGVSDAILFPTLLKLASKEEKLNYRVVPGFAQTKPSLYTEYETLASNVKYLFDGDQDGHGYKSALEQRGVQSNRIALLPDGKMLEDLFGNELYRNTFKRLLNDDSAFFNANEEIGEIPLNSEWLNRMNQNLKNNGFLEISKVAIAYALVEDGESIELDAETSTFLRSIHKMMND